MHVVICILLEIHWSYKICYFWLLLSGIDSQSIRLTDILNLKNSKTIWGTKLIFCYLWSYTKYHAILGYDPQKILANQFPGFFTFDLFDLLIWIQGVHCYIVLVLLVLCIYFNWRKMFCGQNLSKSKNGLFNLKSFKLNVKILKPLLIFILSYHSWHIVFFTFQSHFSLHKKWSFPLRISSVNVTKSGGNWGSGHIYLRNP